MSDNHEGEKRPKKVSEAAPVQVYFARADLSRLDRLTSQLDATKSDVLRRSLLALERELLDPSSHPALTIIGMIDDDGVENGRDVALAHDAVLAHANEAPARRRRRAKS